MRLTLHAARVGDKRDAYQFLAGKPERKRLLLRSRRIREDNIKMYPNEIMC